MLIQGYNSVLEQLDKDQEFLKTSLLKSYIRFANSYDPLFLHHYETRKAEPIKDEPQSVEHLFTIPISKVYRMMRVKQ